MRTRSVWRCSISCVLWRNADPFSWRWTTSSGSIRRQRASSRSHSGVSGTSRSGCSQPSGWGRTWGVPSSSIAPSRPAARADLARPAQRRRRAHAPRGAARPRAHPPGARPCMGSDRGQCVLRARARPRTRPHQHEAHSRPSTAHPREPAGAARRASRTTSDRHRRCPAPGCSARPSDVRSRGRAHGDEARALEALEAAVHEGVVELDGSNVRFAHPLLASICYEQAPVWKRRAVHRALAGVVTRRRGAGPPPGARGGRPRRRRRLRARGRSRAGRARGATGAAAELYGLAADYAGRSRPGAPQALLGRRASTASRATVTSASAANRASSCAEVPHGVERPTALRACLDPGDAPHTLIELLDEALEEAAGDDVRLIRDPRLPELDPPVPGRHRSSTGRRQGSAREGRAGW